jgi:DNA-binding response OmpR family regulator
MKPTVLIVEDEKPLQNAIQDKLIKEGFDTVTARSVGQSLDMLKEIKKIDVVWLDHYLIGRENGLDFVKEMKSNEEWKCIPIFIVSNTATAGKVKRYLELGIEKYYVKAEHRLDEIIKEVKKCLL